jgi:hypothetical protein
MSPTNTITIDSVKYVREDSLQPTELGTKRIVIAERGWVFLGDCEDHENGTVTIRNCKNLRKWGTTKGLGQLTTGPQNGTVADDYGTVIVTPIAQINVISGW